MKRVSLPMLLLSGLLASASLVALHDASVSTREEWSTRGALSGIRAYRRYLSPRLRGFVRCRFDPGCSLYGMISVEKYGALRGGWRAVKRIARCNPWTPAGTVDLP